MRARHGGHPARPVAPPPPVRRPRGLTGANQKASFGARLREEREKRGVTLEQVAASTKIKQSLFAGLERGDLTGWPDGLFKRAFVREYAKVVGLDAERIVAEFGWVYTDHALTGPTVERRAQPRSNVPRLLLDSSRAFWFSDRGLRGVRALADVSCVTLLAAVATAATGVGLAWTVAASAALCYPVCLAWFGETASSYAHGRLVRYLAQPSAARPAEAALRLVTPQDRPSTDRPPASAEDARRDQSRAASR